MPEHPAPLLLPLRAVLLLLLVPAPLPPLGDGLGGHDEQVDLEAHGLVAAAEPGQGPEKRRNGVEECSLAISSI